MPKPKKRRVKAGTTAASKEFKRKLFVQALIANGENRTQAAIDAGYAEGSAAVAGSRMLREPKTQELLEAERKKLQAKFGLTAENVARQLAAIVNFDPRRMCDETGKLLPINEWPDDVAYAVSSLEVTEKEGTEGEARLTIIKPKIWDKNAGIGHALKVLGMSRERLPLDPQPGAAPTEMNMLDAARRIAFTLAMGARIATGQEAAKKQLKEPR